MIKRTWIYGTAFLRINIARKQVAYRLVSAVNAAGSEAMRVTPPGPKGHLVWGNLTAFQWQRLPFLLSLPKYGDVTYLRLGRDAVYVLHRPDLIRQVLIEQPERFQKLRLTRRLFNHALRPISDAQLSRMQAWRQRRELVQTAFQASHVGDFAQPIVEETLALLQSPVWRTGCSLNIYAQLRTLTARIATRLLFGTALAPTQLDEMMQATNALQVRASKRFNALFTIPLWLPTRSNLQIRQAIARLDRLVTGMIAECLQNEDRMLRRDLLAHLVFSSDRHQLGAVREELISLLMSSHETTATALSWVFYLLTQHPEIETRLQTEIQQRLRGNPPTARDNLPYTESVIKESMRLYPPSWIISRRAVESVNLGNYTIPSGALVYIVPYSLHRDARWFPDPDRFKPERFLPEYSDQIPRYAFLPFGTGPRKCIGSAFATLEATLILATVMQCSRLTLLPGQRITPEALITLRPKHGIHLKITRR
jgi:cytochrome P450